MASRTKTLSAIVNARSYPVTVAGGRTLAPGEKREDVDMDIPHNRGLLLDKHIVVLDGFKPRTRQLEEMPQTLEETQ